MVNEKRREEEEEKGSKMAKEGRRRYTNPNFNSYFPFLVLNHTSHLTYDFAMSNAGWTYLNVFFSYKN